MKRDPLGEMERAAKRMLPRPPGIIFAGWFWEEWLMLIVGVVIASGAIYGISFL